MTARGYVTPKRCGCKDPVTGKQLGSKCPRLTSRHHGWRDYQIPIETTGGERKMKRGPFARVEDAQAALDKVRELIALAGNDVRVRQQIGDLIWEQTKRGGAVPAVADVQRRVGIGADPSAPGVTFGEAWTAWLAGKKRLKASARRRLEQIGEHWLRPVLEDVVLERLNGAHCARVFERIEDFNEEIATAVDEEREPVLLGDVRQRAKHVGVASQHRVYAALREFLNFEVRRTRRLTFNPIFSVELEPEMRDEAQRWTAAQARTFLVACADDPLGLLFRIVVLRGARRSEAVGFRWSGADLEAGSLAVQRPILQLGGTITEEIQAKSKAGERKIWLDATTIVLLKAHRKAQLAARLKASTAWLDNDLVFCREDGSPWPPDYVSRRFKAIAKACGVPVIKLHEGRHSAASLARDAAVDPEIRRKTLGHADQAMTSHYTHIEAEAHRAAANQVARFVEGTGA
jgi:integrase